jgi:hypothetical protein
VCLLRGLLREHGLGRVSDPRSGRPAGARQIRQCAGRALSSSLRRTRASSTNVLTSLARGRRAVRARR